MDNVYSFIMFKQWSEFISIQWGQQYKKKIEEQKEERFSFNNERFLMILSITHQTNDLSQPN